MIAVRIPVATVTELRKVAAENERSLSAELRLAARRHLAEQERRA